MVPTLSLSFLIFISQSWKSNPLILPLQSSSGFQFRRRRCNPHRFPLPIVAIGENSSGTAGLLEEGNGSCGGNSSSYVQSPIESEGLLVYPSSDADLQISKDRLETLDHALKMPAHQFIAPQQVRKRRRTDFFLLFKGNPADSIYMEVEFKRLSFLKRAFSLGNLCKVAAGGQNATLIASLKNLRRERGILCKQMQKRMSPEERESIYTKWEIALDSKQRRLQLACRMWTETGDMKHVRESASIVAKIIGLLEPG